MMRLFCLLLLIFILPVASFSAEPETAVAEVINGKSFRLEDGRIVRMAAMFAPNTQEKEGRKRDGEPLGEEAKAALASLVVGKKISIREIDGARDRHGRILAQVYDGDGRWLQEEMIRQGWAMAYGFKDTPLKSLAVLLAAEKEARDAKRGMWSNSYWRIITPEEAPEFLQRFKIIEGTVVSLNEHKGNLYINFFTRWKDKFSLFIPRRYVRDFPEAKSLEGKKIRVRGWIEYHNAPSMDVTHIGQIERL